MTEKSPAERQDVWQGTLALMVLKTLESLGPLHGYGIARRIEQTSGDRLALNYGTIYPALLKLEQEGAIAAEWGASENNRRAKFYTLTRAGRRLLAREEQSWEDTTAILARFLAEHPDTLEAAWMGTATRRPEALSFTAPLANAADLLTYWTDKNTVATFGVTMALGVLVGSFASAWLRGEAKLESFANAAELRDHLIGGLLMGVGGVTALGCSVGNGVTGLAMLSVGAALAVAGIVVGALLALRMHARRAEAAAPSLARA